jgi:hypothetical protein
MEGVALATSIEEKEETQNSTPVNYINVLPNPVSSSTIIQFFLKEAGQVSISVYNILGQEVAVFKDLNYGPGTHNVTWNAGSLPAGTYFINLNTGKEKLTKKVLLVH